MLRFDIVSLFSTIGLKLFHHVITRAMHGNSAIRQDGDLVHDAKDTHAMRGQDTRFALQPIIKFSDQLCLGILIKACRRLVQQNNLRVLQVYASQSHRMPLAN